MSESQLVARLRQIGEERYHHKHPFHLLMHEGKLTRRQLQTAQIETAAIAADTAHDEAVLDMIALEMAAPDFAEDETIAFRVSGPDPAEPVVPESGARNLLRWRERLRLGQSGSRSLARHSRAASQSGT